MISFFYYSLCLFVFLTNLAIDIPSSTNHQTVVSEKSSKEETVERSKLGEITDITVSKTKNIVAHTILKMFSLFKLLQNYASKSADYVGNKKDQMYQWAYHRVNKEESSDQHMNEKSL